VPSSLLTEPRARRPGASDPRREEIIAAFLVEARPWALRQARRRFPHIPDDLYEDVYQQACAEIWQREPRSLDKHSLYAYLARVLTGVLGRVHRAWVHDHAPLTRDDGEPVPLPDSGPAPDSQYDRRHLGALLSELMDRRLLAPERAVLQLQLGAGLDPPEVRRALDMSPRQYKRRRAEGLAKLRDALDDYLHGRVCEDNAGLLAAAATGELPTASGQRLHAHLEHCGACRAEMRRLRSSVRPRFAAAPWPVGVTAPGWLAMKLGSAGSLLGGGAQAAGAGGAAKLAATAVTAAVVAAAGVGALSVSGTEPSGTERAPAVAGDTAMGPPPGALDAWATRSEAASDRAPQPRGSQDRRAGSRQEGRKATEARARDRSARTDAAPATSAPVQGTSPTTGADDPVADVLAPGTDALRDTGQALERAAGEATGQLPSPSAPKAPSVPAPDVGGAVETVTDGAAEAVDGTVKGADGLLAP
jgi:RNA polymerase sigma factor (sigma-70 family)